LKDIRKYTENLGEVKIDQSDFFQESTYANQQNKILPCYLVTKKGCEFIGNKLTGTKGTEFTAKYINRFHDMEEQLIKPMSTIQLMELQFKAIKEIGCSLTEVNNDLQTFKQDMPILALESEKIVKAVKTKGVYCLGGKTSPAYQDKSLIGKVYADIYGQLKREFGVATYKAIKRNQCDLAISIVNRYMLPFSLLEEIRNSNMQTAFA